MRADKIKKWFDAEDIPDTRDEDFDPSGLTNEDFMILGLMEKVSKEGNATAFNALMDARYGKQATGNGEELTGGSEIAYEVVFRGVQKEI